MCMFIPEDGEEDTKVEGTAWSDTDRDYTYDEVYFLVLRN